MSRMPRSIRNILLSIYYVATLLVCSTDWAYSAQAPDLEQSRSFLKKWAELQTSRDINGYLSLYSPDFVGIKRTTNGSTITYKLPQWSQDRTKMYSKAKSLSVFAEDVKLIGTDSHSGVTSVDFTQYYYSESYSDKGQKVMKLTNDGSGIKVLSEELLNSEKIAFITAEAHRQSHPELAVQQPQNQPEPTTNKSSEAQQQVQPAAQQEQAAPPQQKQALVQQSQSTDAEKPGIFSSLFSALKKIVIVVGVIAVFGVLIFFFGIRKIVGGFILLLASFLEAPAVRKLGESIYGNKSGKSLMKMARCAECKNTLYQCPHCSEIGCDYIDDGRCANQEFVNHHCRRCGKLMSPEKDWVQQQ